MAGYRKLIQFARKTLNASTIILGLTTTVATASDWKRNELQCLSRNIYFESLNQSVMGQMAVAHVTLNRVKLDRYPDTICGVITDSRKDKNGEVRRNKCQFSWYCDGKDDTPKNMALWKDAQTVASVSIQIFYTYGDVTGGATHYHASYVSPSWSKTMERVARVDDHIFYDYRRKIEPLKRPQLRLDK